MNVKYHKKNGEEIVLRSREIFYKYQLKEKADLLINPDNIEEYEIGFNLEEKLKKM